MNRAFKLLARSLLLTGAASLVACSSGSGNGSDNNDSSPPPQLVLNSTINGVAATGAAIVNGTVALRCGDGISQTVTSGSEGAWTASVPTDSLPCAVKVSGGTVFGVENTATFYSVAYSNTGDASTANLTPMSDLALAVAVNSAVGSALDVWYTEATDAQFQQVIDGLAAAVASLRTALINAGYTLPSESFDPFIDAITAGEATDLYDQLLDAYKQALSDAGSSYESARGDYIAGGDLPVVGSVVPPIIDVPDTTLAANESGVRFATTGTVLGTAEENTLRTWSGNGSITVGDTAGTLDEVTLLGPEANSYVNFRDIPDAPGTYDCGYGYNDKKANIEIGFAASNGYNTLGTRGSDGTFTQGFRCSITITKVGVNDGGSYSGTLEGSFDAQLYKSGQQVNTRDSISVTGHFRLGTATTTPEVTPGEGVLGTALKNVFAGDYGLNCSVSFGQPVRSFAFSIAADGSSTFEGAPLVDADHAGKVETEGTQSSSITVSFKPSALESAYVVLGFKADGTFYPNSVFVPGQPYGQVYTCYSNSGHTAPASSSQAISTIAAAAAALARSETLSCSQGGATSPQALTINSDGSAQLGAQSFKAGDISKITDNLLFGTAKKGTVSYSDFSTGAFRSLSLDVDSDLKTTGVLASVGLGPDDVIICTP